jgi:hypothetical protein
LHRSTAVEDVLRNGRGGNPGDRYTEPKGDGSMSLLVAGTVLEVTTETVGQPGNQWIQTEVSILTGKSRVERVRLGRDFGDAPLEGQEIVAEVAVRAYSGKSGPGYGLTALADVSDRLSALV